MLKIYYSSVVSEAFFKENYENILKQKVLHTTRIKKINKIKNSSDRCRSLSVGLLASFAFRQEKIDVSEIEILGKIINQSSKMKIFFITFHIQMEYVLWQFQMNQLE